MIKSISVPVCAFLVNLLVLLCGQGVLVTKVEATSNVHIVYLGEKQHDDLKLITDSHHDMLANIVGSKELASELMVYSYKHGFSGFAAKLTESQAQKLSELPGVVRVIPNSLHKLQTTRSWNFLGLSSHSPTNALHNSSMGDGVIIGVFDTGIWPESKAFSDEGLGPIPSHWKGVCISGGRFNPTLHCNKKIIGARWYIDGFLAEYGKPINTSGDLEFLSARDANGHGTHTASTAAGAFVSNVSYKGLAPGIIRGGAPRARLAIYKVCWDVLGGQCSSADILKAIDEAIHDGVDVMSLSIGSSIPLFSDIDERDGIATGSFHAVARGITVVCAAANDGPSAQTVQNTAPWILTVAASTMDRAFPTPIILGNNRTFLGQATFTGKEIGFRGLFYPQASGLDPNAAGACQSLSLNATLVAGKVVLCFTSTARRSSVTSAAEVVKEAGGVGLIVAKNPSDALYPCNDNFPCIEVDFEIGTRILFYIRSTRFPQVKLRPSKTIVGRPLLAKVAYFSSRGPNSIAPAILKPDITAPGVNILAATSPLDPFEDNGYTMHSGTSMSAPHISGIVALLKALHPDWSPAAIKSALVTTAWRNHPSGYPIFAEGSSQKLANPFDIGGGIANPNGAANPGLVYDMGTPDYVHYLCAMGYNHTAISSLTGQPVVCPKNETSILDINLPSITIPNLRKSVTLTRTVTNVGALNSIYRVVIEPPFGTYISVKPDSLVFSRKTKKITFTVTVTAANQVNTGYYFGSLSWTNGVHTVASPMSVRTDILQPHVDEN
ncbi:subtilisin-like protease SBT3.5 [Ricinus communis]|uniref:Cucumisin, putative n=1 Tax=Ricinus communis TaxID=3988 RepID=B9RYW8_RICCO|nr:subtilisin-like protease SBT3.5 [Ricinus communis]EEF43470.1 Cucumisin precursor, putative [Ricinus communis]|eukprot:XP_002518937.1 subtilisin-like protease SBT3.5 [Ricinus communis]